MLPPDISQQILDQFRLLQAGWLATVLPYATKLFWALVIIEFAWAMAILVIELRDHQVWFATLVRKIMWIGFGNIMLLYGPTWLPAIVESFEIIGKQASGMGALSPGDVFVQGLGLSGRVFMAAAGVNLLTNIGDAFILVAAGILTILAFLLISGQLLLAFVDCYISTSVAMIFLGFGGSRWTQPYLERLIALNVSVGLKLMLLYLLVSAGQTLAGQWLTWADAITGPSGIVSSWAIAGAALLYAAVCWHVPRFLSGMLSGAAGFSIGEVTSTAGSIALAGYAGYHVMAGAKAALAHSMAGVNGAITGAGANGAHTGSAAAGFNGSGGGHTAGPPSSVPPPTVPPPAPAALSSGSYVPPPASPKHYSGAPTLDAAATLYTMHQAMPGPSEAPAPPPQTPLGDRD